MSRTRQRAAEGAFRPRLPMPVPPTPPAALTKAIGNMTVQDAQSVDRLDREYRAAIVQFRAARLPALEERSMLLERLREALEAEYGTADHPQAAAIFETIFARQRLDNPMATAHGCDSYAKLIHPDG